MEREEERELLGKLSTTIKIIEKNAYFQSKTDLLLKLEKRNIVRLSKTEKGGIISCVLTNYGEKYKQNLNNIT
jgi:hypothetical protein